MPIRLRRGVGGGSAPPTEAVATRNILNGVLNCKWDKTSAVPSLLEIANTSEVKFNIDATTPLVLRFADGWDDNDQPKGIVKTLATAPSNIDLSAKVSCHVQICAKVVNDELVITTHDIYDPGWEVESGANPVFDTGYTDVSPFNATNKWRSEKDGWAVYQDSLYSTCYPRKAVDASVTNADGGASTGNAVAYWYIDAPFSFSAYRIGIWSEKPLFTRTLDGYDEDTQSYVPLCTAAAFPSDNKSIQSLVLDLVAAQGCYKTFRLKMSSGSSSSNLYYFKFYERPTAKFFRGINKVKDRTDTEVYWINLGYATMDANGAITALSHYTDLRNNYPGGMRVEA